MLTEEVIKVINVFEKLNINYRYYTKKTVYRPGLVENILYCYINPKKLIHFNLYSIIAVYDSWAGRNYICYCTFGNIVANRSSQTKFIYSDYYIEKTNMKGED